MKIECIKDRLQEAVGKVDRVVNKNSALPILSCVLFIAKDNSLIIKATNLEIGVEIIIPGKVIKEGVIAVQGGLISSVISSIKSQKITLEEIPGNNLKISGESAVVNLKTVVPDDFPLIPRLDAAKTFTLPTKDFIFGLKSVVFSASTSSIKPELGSIFINHKDGHLVFAATDSFRLAEKKIPVKSAEPIPQILFPLKNAVEFIKIFDQSGDKLSLIVQKNQLSVSNESTYFTSRVVDGVFPDYEQIIPKEPTTNSVLLKQDLSDAIRTTTTVADKYNQIVFDIKAKKPEVNVKTKNSDVGEGDILIKSKNTGDDIEISFNQKYISETLPSIPDDSVVLKFGGPHKPLLIEGTQNKNFRYLVMPMNR